METEKSLSRRRFLQTTGATLGASLLTMPFGNVVRATTPKKRVALVGTGVRGVRMFGQEMLRDYSETIDLVGICDINPGRLAYGKTYIGSDAPTFTDIDEMLEQVRPETLLVVSRDDVHHEHIIKGLEAGCDVICEKPMTIDEEKAQAIIDAERKNEGKVIITFNYRYPPYRAKMKQLIMEGLIGDIQQVEFHWNITHSHMMRYMQRWHGHQKYGGSLWVHKSTHHFDMVNWYLDSDPVQVHAYGSLNLFGKNNDYRGNNCRDCHFTEKCPYYWDIRQDNHLRSLYTDNEHYDGYIRDNCVFREDIDIFDRQVALVKYGNGAYLNYSLSSHNEYEGYWMALNGSKGRLEVRTHAYPERDYEELLFTPNRRYSDDSTRVFRVLHGDGGHWGGDPIMTDQLFKNPGKPDPLGQQAGVRDGVMSILVGVAARKSIATGRPVDIRGMTDIEPMAKRPG
jgi:predicted dehydrogenase